MHTFVDPILHAELVSGDRLALASGDRRFTYGEFAIRCRRLGAALDDLGVGRGERVAILSGNDARYVETYMGVPASGRVVVPLNTRHAEPELRYALEDSGTMLLLTDRDPGGLADVVERVVSLPDEYDGLLDGASERPFPDDLMETDLAGLFYTGGTTGASKGVMLTHRNLISNAFHWLTRIAQRPDDRFLVMAPLFHAAGSNQIISTIWTGGSQITLGAFDPAAALDLIEAEKITVTLGVPTMLLAMTEEQLARPRETGTVRAIGHGGSPIATEILRRLHQAIPSADLFEVYGATELSPLATLLGGEQDLVDDDRGRSCGQPLPGVRIRILDSTGAEQTPGEVGEVVVSGPNVMAGYWNKKEQTDSVLRDGWYWSGDLGYLDDGGYLFLVDRSKDMIVSGGENVYSTEVEEALFKHPGVLEAAVFGVPDEKWGEAVHAVVVPRAGTPDPDPVELIAFCRERIAGYKVPKAVDIRHDPLPKSGPGKVLKRELRAPFWEGKDRQVS